MARPKPSHSFTVASTAGPLRVIQTQCHLCAAYDPADGEPGYHRHSFQAIWDTGATGTVITQAVVDACGLKPTGMVNVHGVSGAYLAETYLVNVMLPNTVQIASVQVTKGVLPGGTGGDVLIGMDIITLGDFAITNLNARTVCSFRIPSSTRLDFVREHEENGARSRGAAPAGRPVKSGKSFGKKKR